MKGEAIGEEGRERGEGVKGKRMGEGVRPCFAADLLPAAKKLI